MTERESGEFKAFPAALWQALLIVLVGSAFGLMVNSARHSGIPLVGSVRVVKFDTPAAPPPGEIIQDEPEAPVEMPVRAEPDSEASEPHPLESPAALPQPDTETKQEGQSGGVEVFSPLPVAAPEERGEGDGGPKALDLVQALELYEGGTTIFVDARNPDEFVAGHIPGAFNLPYEELESYLDVLNYLSDDGLVVTYCDGTECELSLELADELTAMGFGQVRVFFGGWEQWLEAGYPVEEGEPMLP